MDKFGANGECGASRNEQKKLAAYLRDKDRKGGNLSDNERRILNQIDDYTYLSRYDNQDMPSHLTNESGKKTGPYAYLEDGPTVGEGKDFTLAQKKKMLEENMRRNGGVVKSDAPDDYQGALTKPKKA